MDATGFRKLVGCLETNDGTAMSESELKSLYEEWEVLKEICGLGFDTTS